MRLFIKIFADDLKSASQTSTIVIKGSFKDLTLAHFKEELEKQIKPLIPAKNQIISINKTGLIV